MMEDPTTFRMEGANNIIIRQVFTPPDGHEIVEQLIPEQRGDIYHQDLTTAKVEGVNNIIVKQVFT